MIPAERRTFRLRRRTTPTSRVPRRARPARDRRRARALPARPRAGQGLGLLRRGGARTTAWPGRSTTARRRPERVATLRRLGVRTFAPLVYPHKPGMARWLTEWVTEFAATTPARCRRPPSSRSRTWPSYLGAAVAAGARVVKVHVQVGGFDPRDPLLRPAWGLLAEAGRAGGGALRQRADARARTPGWTCSARCWPSTRALPVVLAHAGMPEFAGALDLRAPLRGRPAGHDDGRHAVQPAVRPAARRLAGPARRRRRTGSCFGIRLPEHPLRLRRTAAAR